MIGRLRPGVASSVSCFHCGSSSTVIGPVFSPTPEVGSTQFASKCGITPPGDLRCDEIRLFSFVEVPIPRLTEVDPTLRAYPFIVTLEKLGGYRKDIASLLRSACELHLIGQLEGDPASEEAAYNGAAVFVGMAAELFLRRWVGWKHPGRKVKKNRAGAATSRRRALGPARKARELWRVLRQARKGAFKNGYDQKDVAKRILYIFDLRDHAAHPVLDFSGARQRNPGAIPALGTVNIALSHMKHILDQAGWPT